MSKVVQTSMMGKLASNPTSHPPPHRPMSRKDLSSGWVLYLVFPWSWALNEQHIVPVGGFDVIHTHRTGFEVLRALSTVLDAADLNVKFG